MDTISCAIYVRVTPLDYRYKTTVTSAKEKVKKKFVRTETDMARFDWHIDIGWVNQIWL